MTRERKELCSELIDISQTIGMGITNTWITKDLNGIRRHLLEGRMQSDLKSLDTLFKQRNDKKQIRKISQFANDGIKIIDEFTTRLANCERDMPLF